MDTGRAYTSPYSLTLLFSLPPDQEKDLDKIGKEANEEFKQWNAKVEQTEKAFLDISKEREKLCKEKQEIEQKLKQFDGKVEINA